MSEELKSQTEAEAAEKPETMDDYKEELEASLRTVQEGDILTGTVTGVTDTEILVDLQYYAQGIIPKEHYTNDAELSLKDTVHPGDKITASVLKKDDGEGNILLSRKEANDRETWDRFQALLESHEIFPVKITGMVNAGMIAMVDGVRGFIPASRLDASYVENLEEWIGKTVDVMVITVDEEKKKLVLSAREAARMKIDAQRKEKAAKCQVGSVVEGVVESIQKYGAFVRLDNGLSGLVHISQMSMKRIKSPSEVVNVGDKISAKIISTEKGKISLSMKALEDVAEKEEESETLDYKEEGQASTSLGSLLKGLKL